jgi:acetyl esterase/lipase
MKKIVILACLLVAGFALAACQRGQPSRAPEPTATTPPTSGQAYNTAVFATLFAAPLRTTTKTATPASTTPQTIEAKPGASYRDVTYCTPDGIAQKMNVFYPKQLSDKPIPITVYIHGGGWTSGDKGTGAGAADMQGLLARGFIVASLDYRLAPQYKWPSQITDVKCAIRYLRANAASYKLDPNKIGVWGGSAGGHLVSLVGTADSSAGWDVGEYLDQSSHAQAVVDMFGPADLTHGSATTGLQIKLQWDVFGSTSDTDPILAAASPVTYVTADDSPFLILQGDADSLVPPEQSQIFFDKLQAAGVPSELVVIRHAGHGFQQVGDKPIRPSLIKLVKVVVAFFTRYLK